MESPQCNKGFGFLIMVVLFSVMGDPVQSRTVPSTPLPTKRHFDFNIEWKKVSLLCSSKAILTVNGQYPGPTITVYEGDEVEVTVTNSADCNITIHWHGIRQYRTGWADGPAYITQCPIQYNGSYTYKFRVDGQRGTFWWHAHESWHRLTVHGAFIIHPRTPYPFPTSIHQELLIILGEWWKVNIQDMVTDLIESGAGPNASDAYTINGLPGPLFSCSFKDTFVQNVEHGKTYMLRIINAALNVEHFFGVANHMLTVVEVDGIYVKPLTTPAIMIAPGQTTNVLLKANQASHIRSFPMAARPYITGIAPTDKIATVGFIQYHQRTEEEIELQNISHHPTDPQSLSLHWLPSLQDTAFNTKFSNKLRSLASTQFPCMVPKKVDKQVFLTLSLNLQDCPPNQRCKGFQGKRFSASINNQSFVKPSISILECYYQNHTNHVLSLDFPEKPPHPFNYTGMASEHANANSEYGNKLLSVPYGTYLEFVLQDTSIFHVENHPLHIHGHNFFIVGSGFGNFDGNRDPESFNLVDPPERNTVAVPSGGWVAIRFKADNPGVWFIHCHIEGHTTWGLATGIIVANGPEPSQTLLPPPKDLPKC